MRNEPKSFRLTKDTLLESLLEWLPDQLHRMRDFSSAGIVIKGNFDSLECRYMQTVGGEKFRIFDRTPFGDSGSSYHSPLGSDDDVIMEMAQRICRRLDSIDKVNRVIREKRDCHVEMEFLGSVFSEPTAKRGPTRGDE